MPPPVRSWRDVPAINPNRGATLNGYGLGSWRAVVPVSGGRSGSSKGDGRGQPNDLERTVAERALRRKEPFSITDAGGKLLMGALDALDTPRATVASAVNQLTNAAIDEPVSWDQFVQDARRNITMGEAAGIPENDPLAGFALDVIADPLTYVTGGAGKVGTEAGLPAAKKLLTKEAETFLGEAAVSAAERAGTTYADDAARKAAVAAQGKVAASQAAQKAVKFKSNQMLDDLAREFIGAKPGTYLRVPLKIDKIVEKIAPGVVVEGRSGQNVIRLTEKELGLGKLGGRLRARLTQGGFGNAMAKLFTKYPDMREALLFGKPEDAAKVILSMGKRSEGDLKRRWFETIWGEKWAHIADRAKAAGIDGEDLRYAFAETLDDNMAGPSITRVLHQAAARGDEALVEDIKGFMPAIRDAANSIDPEMPWLMMRENYTTRLPSDEMIAARGGAGGFGNAGGALKRETFDFRRQYGVEKDQIDTLFGRKLVKQAEDPLNRSVDQQIDDILREEGVKNWFEKDAYKSMPDYVRRVARRFGDEHMAKGLRDLGIADLAYIKDLSEKGYSQSRAKAYIHQMSIRASARGDKATRAARAARIEADNAAEAVARGEEFVQRAADEGADVAEAERKLRLMDTADSEPVREYEAYLRDEAATIQVRRDALMDQVDLANDEKFIIDHTHVEAAHRVKMETYHATSRITKLEAKQAKLRRELETVYDTLNALNDPESVPAAVLKEMAANEQRILEISDEMKRIEDVLQEFEDLAAAPTDQLEQQLVRVDQQLGDLVPQYDSSIGASGRIVDPLTNGTYPGHYNAMDAEVALQAWREGPPEGYVRLFRGQANDVHGRPVHFSDDLAMHRQDSAGRWFTDRPMDAFEYAEMRSQQAGTRGIDAQSDILFVDVPESRAFARRVDRLGSRAQDMAGGATREEFLLTRADRATVHRIPADLVHDLRQDAQRSLPFMERHNDANRMLVHWSGYDQARAAVQRLPTGDADLANKITTLSEVKASILHERGVIERARARIAEVDRSNPAMLLGEMDDLTNAQDMGDKLIHSLFPDLPDEVNGAHIRDYMTDRMSGLQADIDETQGQVISAFADRDTMRVELSQIRQQRRETQRRLRGLIKNQTAEDRALAVQQNALLTQADEAMNRALEIDAEHEALKEAMGDIAMRQMDNEYASRIAEGYLNAMHARQLRYEAIAVEREASAAQAQKTARFWKDMGKANYGKPLEEAWIRSMPSNFKAIGAVSMTKDAWLVDGMRAATVMMGPEGIRPFLHGYDRILNLWKGYALSMPGTVFRNLFGATFNNWLADAAITPKHYAEYLAYTFGGKLSPEKRAIFKEIEDAGLLVGSGTMLEVERQIGTKNLRPWSTDFRPLAFMRRRQQNVENLARGTLAYKTILDGGTIQDAIDRVMKYHFDYDDLSSFERSVMRRIVPFYTWTRKNFPLMLEQMAQKPTKFTRFYQAKNEIERMSPEEAIVPSYFGENLGVRLPFHMNGGQGYMLPDLPFTTLNDVTDPTIMFSQASPFIKTPLEYAFGKQVFKNIPLKDEYQPVPKMLQVIPGVMPALDMVGLARQGANGEWMMKQKDMYVMEQFLPAYGRARRLFPSEQKYSERLLSTWLSMGFGVGLRTNTPTDQRNEARRRVDREMEWVNTQVELGNLVPGEDKLPRFGQTVNAAYQSLGVERE